MRFFTPGDAIRAADLLAMFFAPRPSKSMASVVAAQTRAFRAPVCIRTSYMRDMSTTSKGRVQQIRIKSAWVLTMFLARSRNRMPDANGMTGQIESDLEPLHLRQSN